MKLWISLFALCLAASGCSDETIITPAPDEENAGNPGGMLPVPGGNQGQPPAGADNNDNPPPPSDNNNPPPPSDNNNPPPPPNDDNNPPPPPANTGCDFNATAAVKITGAVNWPAGLAVEAGQGQIEIWFKGELDHQGNLVNATGPVCSTVVPDFHTSALAGGDTHGTVIPPDVWSSPGIPATAFEVQLGGADPGATLVANPTAMLLGLQMNDALNDPWPASYRQTQAVDHDGDGNPGITAYAATGGAYSNPRVDIFNPALRADRLFLALRTIIGLDGQVMSCDSAEGSATLILEQRIVGCGLDSGQPCSDAQVQTIDQNTPVFNVEGASFKLQRVAPGATCDQIIAAIP